MSLQAIHQTLYQHSFKTLLEYVPRELVLLILGFVQSMVGIPSIRYWFSYPSDEKILMTVLFEIGESEYVSYYHVHMRNFDQILHVGRWIENCRLTGLKIQGKLPYDGNEHLYERYTVGLMGFTPKDDKNKKWLILSRYLNSEFSRSDSKEEYSFCFQYCDLPWFKNNYNCTFASGLCPNVNWVNTNWNRELTGERFIQMSKSFDKALDTHLMRFYQIGHERMLEREQERKKKEKADRKKQAEIKRWKRKKNGKRRARKRLLEKVNKKK